MLKVLRRYFLAGLLVIAPTAITAFVVWKVFITIDNLIGPLQRRYPILDFPGLGLVVVILLILTVGFLASNLVGRRLIGGGERLLNRLPLVRRIYAAVKELSEVFLTDKKTAFRHVVLIRYPHRDAYVIAFVTYENAAYFRSVIGEEMVSVFLPTTPNPTSGFLLLVPKRDVIPLEMSIEDAMKMVISGGVFMPRAIMNWTPTAVR